MGKTSIRATTTPIRDLMTNDQNITIQKDQKRIDEKPIQYPLSLTDA